MAKTTKKQQKCVSKKMHKMADEPRKQSQKVAIALRTCGVPKKKK